MALRIVDSGQMGEAIGFESYFVTLNKVFGTSVGSGQ